MDKANLDAGDCEKAAYINTAILEDSFTLLRNSSLIVYILFFYKIV